MLVMQKALKSCLEVNAPLIVRATSKIPYSVLKYAMTLDGTHYNYTLFNLFLKQLLIYQFIVLHLLFSKIIFLFYLIL